MKPSVNVRQPGSFNRAVRDHIRNFLDCIKTRQDPNATVEMGHATNIVLVMALESLRSGRRVRWNGVAAPYRNVMVVGRVVLLLWCAVAVHAAALEGTAPFDIAGDPAEHMVKSIKEYLLDATRASVKGRKPAVARLRQILGVVDERVPFRDLETFGTPEAPRSR